MLSLPLLFVAESINSAYTDAFGTSRLVDIYSRPFGLFIASYTLASFAGCLMYYLRVPHYISLPSLVVFFGTLSFIMFFYLLRFGVFSIMLGMISGLTGPILLLKEYHDEKHSVPDSEIVS
jgi:hypothetical protein